MSKINPKIVHLVLYLPCMSTFMITMVSHWRDGPPSSSRDDILTTMRHITLPLRANQARQRQSRECVISSGRRGYTDGHTHVVAMHRPHDVCRVRPDLLAFTDSHVQTHSVHECMVHHNLFALVLEQRCPTDPRVSST